MKLIVAIIKPFKLELVKEALTAVGVAGMTSAEVKGFGRPARPSSPHRGSEDAFDCLPKVRLEIAVNDDLVPAVIDTILGAARTGRSGDGKIFVLPVEDVVRIRAGERSEAAV